MQEVLRMIRNDKEQILAGLKANLNPGEKSSNFTYKGITKPEKLDEAALKACLSETLDPQKSCLLSWVWENFETGTHLIIYVSSV